MVASPSPVGALLRRIFDAVTRAVEARPLVPVCARRRPAATVTVMVNHRTRRSIRQDYVLLLPVGFSTGAAAARQRVNSLASAIGQSLNLRLNAFLILGMKMITNTRSVDV